MERMGRGGGLGDRVVGVGARMKIAKIYYIHNIINGIQLSKN